MKAYASRKFIITMLGMLATVGLAYLSKMDGDVAIVLAAGIASYNYCNYKASGK